MVILATCQAWRYSNIKEEDKLTINNMRKKYLVILLATAAVAAGIFFIRQRSSAPVPLEKANISIGLPISPSVGLV